MQAVVRVAEQMLFGLEHVHKFRIVHRNIKPENLLVSLTDPSKILSVDFGLSRFFGPGVPSHYDPRATSLYLFIGRIRVRATTPNLWRTFCCSPSAVIFRGDLKSGLRPSNSTLYSMRRIQASKVACTDSALATNFLPEFARLLDYSRGLVYGQAPDYEDLQARFGRLAESLGCEAHVQLDWLRQMLFEARCLTFSRGKRK
ncbi:hypothetical protein C8R45DRAFT_1145174 [Mycena sanguinolenta]|nr:hypothetical protein C8R45DRAFT_1145174 [Mycena sanguinolenta]